MKIIRYRIYQVIKWVFAVFSLVTIAAVYILGDHTQGDWPIDKKTAVVLMGSENNWKPAPGKYRSCISYSLPTA